MSSSVSDEAPQRAVVQAITGLVPPSSGEAKLRTTWPTVMDAPFGLSAWPKMGATLLRTRILAPLAWLVLAPLFFRKLLPIFGKRYTLTNRRVLVQRGLTAKTKQEVALKDIDEIRLEDDSYHSLFHSGNLEIYSGGQMVLKLIGVAEPQGFRNAILNAMTAWVPEKAKALPMLPASEMAK